MTEMELFERCNKLGVCSDIVWYERHGWLLRGRIEDTANAHAILTARLAEKVRGVYPKACAFNDLYQWHAEIRESTGVKVTADSELLAWLLLAEKVFPAGKAGEVKEPDDDCCSVGGAVARVNQEDAFEAECRELYRLLYVKYGADDKAEQAIKHYRARFGPKGGDV